MACKIEIEKTINQSIDRQLPSREAVMSKNAAQKISSYLNDLWTSAISRITQYSADGGYKIVINSLTDAVNKEFSRQVEAEQQFERDLDFFNGDEALYEQENKDFVFFQENELINKASGDTLKVVADFLKRIGVKAEVVNKIVVNGNVIGANGVANLTQGLVQVVEGKVAETLPEEAMHFAVEIIEQTNPKLFQQLLKEINNYQTLKDVFAQYGQNPYYQTKEGKPDVLKLKKEAIGKVLADTLINKAEGLNETQENIAKVESWWDKIIDWLKSLFTKSGFDQAAMDILSGKDIGTVEDIFSEGDYLQLDKQAEVYNKIKEISSTIEKKEDGYYVNGRKTRRVTDIVKDWYDNRFKTKDLTKSEYQKAVDELKAEKGTDGHADIEHAFDMFVDENGNLRDEPLNDEEYISRLDPKNRDMYELLKTNLEQRLKSFEPGTKFMSEATVFDASRNIAGTVDFLAISPEGKVSILDWKFMDLNVDRYDDIPWYKINAWNLQMNQYKYIISKTYNVKSENFGQTRMIPIRAIYTKGNVKENILPKLVSVKIGDVNVQNITEDYLLPVGLQKEKTGNKKIDELLEKLNAVYQKLSDKKAIPSEKATKAEQLNSLFYAIRQLHIKQNIKPLLDQAKILNKQIQLTLDRYDSEFKGKNANDFTDREISDFAETVELSKEALSTYTNLDTELRFLFKGELSPEDKILKEELKDTVEDAREYADLLNDVDMEFTENIIAKKENVEGLSTPEKIVKGMTKMFGTTSTIQLKSLEVLFKKANKSNALSSIDTLSEMKRLEQIKENYEAWAKQKGIAVKDMFNAIKKKGSNQLIDEFKKEFYSTLKKKINDKDFTWIRNNIDEKEYRQYITEKREEEIKRVTEKTRVGSPEEIMKDIKRDLQKIKDIYDLTTSTSVGWLLYNDIAKFPKRDIWESEEWKNLSKEENKPAKEFYDYIRERNDYYKEIGYINAKQARTFLPWIRKGLAEKLVFGGDIRLGESFLRAISVDEEEVGYGKIDPLTGKPVDVIPTYFTKEFDGEYSEDLFKTMAIYNQYAIKFKYLSDIEAQARALVRVEKNKKAIATSIFGKTQYKDGVIEYVNDNSENTKLVEDMVKAIVYQQKYIQSETFDQLMTKIGGFGKTFNDKLGMKVFPENLEGRQISVNKAITQLNNNFQIAALGFNALSAISNYFGGTAQSLINSGKYFTKTDFMKTQMWVLANKMNGGEDKKKAIAAMEYFVPFTEDFNRDFPKQLSMKKLDEQSIQDFLMILMRNGDRAVQVINFFSFLNNSIVIDDKVVNAREYLRSQEEYKNFYSGTSQERKQRSEKFEQEVAKLIDEKGVLKVSELKDGKLIIPGVDQKSDSIVEFRRKVQQFTSDALGSLTEENKRLINMNVYGASFMVFKNWIPRLVDVRLGNLKYNSASDAYEWGRTRMVFRVITEDFKNSLGNLYNSIQGNEKGIEFIRELYEKKKTDYEKDTGKELNLTEDEFIELVRQNIKNQLVDVLFYGTLFALALGLKALAPDDEDKLVKNQYNFMLKATDKLKDEIGYFYDPTSFIGLVSKGIFPSLGLINSYQALLTNFMKENYALLTGDEESAEKNYVIKHLLKSFPITNQGAALLPMFYPQLAKDLGIRMQSQYGFK